MSFDPSQSDPSQPESRESSAPQNSDATEPVSAEPRVPNPFLSDPVSESIVEAEIANDPYEMERQMGRLHPLSLVFEAISQIRALIIPAVIAVFSAANGSVEGLIFAGVIFVPTLIRSIVRYFSLRYQIRESELTVTQGIFFQRIRTVPIERIQNIDLIQNVMHRVFNVAEVRIETASGTEPEATLRVLSMAKVEQLREAIFNPRIAKAAIRATDAPASELLDLDGDADAHYGTQQVEALYRISTSELFRAGLASNRGTLLLGVLFGLYFQFDEQLNIDLKQVVRTVSEGMETATLVFVSLVIFVGLLVLFRLLGIAWYILRFHGYELSRSGEDLRIRCGLFTKVSATVPRKRIQFISIQQNLIMRWMKLASIRIETAGAAGKGQEDATKTVSSRWFLPVVHEEKVRELIEVLRPGLVWDWESFNWQPISPKAAKRMMRLAILSSLLVGFAGYLSLDLWGVLLGVVSIPPFLWYAIKRSKSKKFARTDDIIAYRSGIFTRRTSMTFFEKIQTVSVYQSPFDRRWDMATLCVDTAAAGPAGHKIHIGYLTSDFAKAEYNAIVKKSSGLQPVFS